jgi:hypothetical protein
MVAANDLTSANVSCFCASVDALSAWEGGIRVMDTSSDGSHKNRAANSAGDPLPVKTLSASVERDEGDTDDDDDDDDDGDDAGEILCAPPKSHVTPSIGNSSCHGSDTVNGRNGSDFVMVGTLDV